MEVEFRQQGAAETTAATRDVFAGENSAEAGEVEGSRIDAFFVRLGEATRSEGELVVADFISVDGMFESLSKSGVLDGLSARERADVKKGFKHGSGAFAASMRQMAYDDHRVLRVETLDENEALVYLRHYDNVLNITSQIRWWLVDTADGWRIYDFEDLSVGLRVVNLMGTLIKTALAVAPDPWVEEFTVIVQQLQVSDLTDPESFLALESPLLQLREHALPEEIKRFASVLMTATYQAKAEPEASLAELEAAVAGGYQSPMHHYLKGNALVQLERYEEAVAAYEIHAGFLGWDSDVLENVSDAYFMLGKMQEARGAALQGLEDNPRSINCLASLAAASSPEEIASAQTSTLFTDCGDPVWAYEVAMDYTIEVERMPQAEALFAQFKAKYPDSELLEYYQGIFQTAGPDAP